jgi:low temperature requirement protein LtrA
MTETPVVGPPPTTPGAAAALAAEGHEQRVTSLELFFDLVFAFAFTQVTAYVAADPTWTRLLEGLAILTVTWWAWGCYAWLGNSAASDDGLFRVVLLCAMAAMLIVGLAVPHAFGADALIFGVAYAVVRLLHIVAYAQLGRDDPQLRMAVAGLARSMIPVSLLILGAGVFDGTARTVLWIVAVTVDVAGLWLFGVRGWRVEAHHLAERYSLILIIALGESIVSLGIGAESTDLDGTVILGALLGIATAGAMWWAYFDIAALVAERRFGRATGEERVRLARDSYTYLHLPMVMGVILFALGVKKVLGHVDAPLQDVPAVALCDGVALYFLAHVAFRWRNVRRLNVARLAAAIVLAALTAVALHVDALVSLALVAAVSVALVAYEHVRYRELHHRLRGGSVA